VNVQQNLQIIAGFEQQLSANRLVVGAVRFFSGQEIVDVAVRMIGDDGNAAVQRRRQRSANGAFHIFRIEGTVFDVELTAHIVGRFGAHIADGA
jgi:hypothetical protein